MGSLTPYSSRVPAFGEDPRPNTEVREFSRFCNLLWRRKRLFLTVFAGFVALVALATLLTPKSYTATAHLMAGNPGSGASQNNDTSLPILNALVLQSGEQSAETFALLAQQEDVATDVARSLGLNMPAKELLTHLTVKPVVNTAILNLSISWHDPENAARIANEFSRAFISRERDVVRSQATAALGFLDTELPSAEKRMHDAAGALAAFQASHGFIDAGTHTQDVVNKSTELQSKIEGTQLDSREAAALLANVDRQMAAMPASIDSAQQITVNPVLSDLQTKLESVNVQLADAEQQYTDQHPLVISLRKQRDTLIAQIAREPREITSGNTLAPNPIYQSLAQQETQYKQRIDGDAAQLALLQRQRSAMLPMLKQLPDQSMRYATLEQRAKLAADVYSALEQKYNDAMVARTTAISDISVIQPATADSAIKRPSLKINLLVGAAIGLLLGVIAVFIVDALESRVREGETPDMLGLPVIARIPALDTVNRRMLPWVQSMTIEAFLHLCVTLRLKTKHPLRTLAITSACRGDGKSTIAFNLAKAMANLESRVLLIDADLRCPTLHELAACPNTLGLSDVLSSGLALSECVREVAPHLDLLTSGNEVENPVKALQGHSFDLLLRTAADRYGIVIVDSPALASVTDGLLISTRVDGTVFVVAANTTEEAQAKRIVSQFAVVGIDNILGIVVNRDVHRMNDYSDYFAQSRRGALPG